MNSKNIKDNTRPKVSIIVPTYNYGSFIEETLRSVLNQTFTDYEVIVVDDGSTDKSHIVVSNIYKEFNGRLYYIYQKNHGAYVARNVALKVVRGEYISFLDADDIWVDSALEDLVFYLDSHPELAMAYGNTKYFDTNTRRVIGYGFGEKSDKKPYVGKCVDKLFIFGNFIPAMACLLRREAIEDIGLFNEKSKVGEDYEYWLRLTSKYSIGYVDKILCSVRRHEHNLTFKFLKQAYSNLLTIKNVLNCVPYLAELVGPKNVQKKMYSIYYRLGIYSILDGHRKRGRTLLGRAWRLNPNPFINKIWPYYSLSYFPWIKPIARVREGLRLVKRVLRRGC